MVQTIIITLFFLIALGYIIVIVRRQFSSKNNCSKGCGCSAIDLEKLEKELKK